MISRRFFLKAVGAGLLGASAAGRAAITVVPTATEPDPTDGGVMEVFTAGGTRLCSAPLRVSRGPDRVAISGCDPNAVSGTPAVVRWRLPGGRVLEGKAGTDQSCDLRLGSSFIGLGDSIAIEIVVTMEDAGPIRRSRMLDALVAESARGSWGTGRA